ncbi:hypothetical protein EFW17_21870 [Halostreptopolyspora alba]|uniref:Uncharacterized protein n=1 Tax=Halostreptopolyspora alba TaxID=2487137 RepID=A0A3N0E155_9ACTN|nr:hypothetical protein EFW17_21870 [Nocardiopsaceae bacterium YIM 96095]
MLVPDCAHVIHDQGDEVNVWFLGLTDRSWALVRYTGDNESDVPQSGPRRLRGEIETAYRWWDSTGCGWTSPDRWLRECYSPRDLRIFTMALGN